MIALYDLTEVTIGGSVIPVRARLNPRSKHFKLRFDRDYGSLILTFPQKKLQKKALEFLERSRPWIEKTHQVPESLIRFLPGEKIPYQGGELLLTSIVQDEARLSVTREGNVLILKGPLDFFKDAVVAYLREESRTLLAEKATYYSAQLGVTYNRLFIRNSRSNWGCCSSKKNISFSWRLILTPPEVLDYVVVHEICHLVEMNHSKKFWSLVETLCPTYKKPYLWLKKQGKKHIVI